MFPYLEEGSLHGQYDFNQDAQTQYNDPSSELTFIFLPLTPNLGEFRSPIPFPSRYRCTQPDRI
jgi:hypothetical protein